MVTFGVQTNAQNKLLSELIEVWKHVDDLGYGWISIPDHFPGSLGPISNEAVATQASMAASTSRAKCGVLVYSIGFRHPIVLASAVTTIDHLSGGRAAIGLGSGSTPKDYQIYGFRYPSLKERTDMLEEGLECLSRLLRGDTVNFSGKHFHLSEALNAPAPVQDKIPLWVGTNGERRGLRLAAQYADGVNFVNLSSDVFARKRDVLRRHCADTGRDPTTMQCSINLALMPGTEPSSLPEEQRETVLAGSVGQIVDRLDSYVSAGADQINFNLPYPWPFDELAELARALGLSSSPRLPPVGGVRGPVG